MCVNFYPLSHTNLPVYRMERAGETWFYAPGYLVLVRSDKADEFAAQAISPVPGNAHAATLVRRAARAQASRAASLSEPYAPLCLTLYLNNICNLACGYCYAQPLAEAAPRLEIDMIRAAANLVAENCASQGQRLTVVFHGGGEPSLELARLEQALDCVEEVAQRWDVGVFRYIATNGVMPEEKAAWLASHFDLIGLSCDGPQDIQTRQRPLRNSQSSTPWVEQTARVVRQAGKPLHVRLTITPQALARQAEIAAYLCERLHPQEIHAEPVYRPGLTGQADCFQPEQVQAFIQGFLEGRLVARQAGVRWTSSGSRPAELHGPYCHVFRPVLNLIPTGQATACFRLSRLEDLQAQAMQIGKMDAENGQYRLDSVNLSSLRQVLSRIPEPCQACFNQYHCVRGCPDHCLVEADTAQVPAFRCQVNQGLALAALEACADELRLHGLGVEGVCGGEVFPL